ncbi:MAG: hypothetical protein CL878_07175 [Dehalococcoidia bacterium]|nr:hypothetical protein [Dehalococcoidia bacterium]
MLVNRFSRLVGDHRVSVREVSQAVGISYATMLALYHNRTTRIDFATIDKLCTYFGVDTQHLLEWQPEEGSDG